MTCCTLPPPFPSTKYHLLHNIILLVQCQLLCTSWYDVTSQKTRIFIRTALRVSQLAHSFRMCLLWVFAGHWLFEWGFLCTFLGFPGIYQHSLIVVLYGCETWLLTLREERRLRVFENRVLRRVFGPKRDEVTGEWRKLHNEELSDLYSLPNIVRVVKSRRMKWVGHVGGGERCAQGSGGQTWGIKTVGETQT